MAGAIFASCARPPLANAFVGLASTRTPALLALGRLGKSEGCLGRTSVRGSPRFDRGTRACAPDRSGRSSSPAQLPKYEEPLSKVSVRNPPELRAAGRQREGLGKGRGGPPGGPLTKAGRRDPRYQTHWELNPKVRV